MVARYVLVFSLGILAGDDLGSGPRLVERLYLLDNRRAKHPALDHTRAQGK